jgi:hypothetical protein
MTVSDDNRELKQIRTDLDDLALRVSEISQSLEKIKRATMEWNANTLSLISTHSSDIFFRLQAIESHLFPGLERDIAAMKRIVGPAPRENPYWLDWMGTKKP